MLNKPKITRAEKTRQTEKSHWMPQVDENMRTEGCLWKKVCAKATKMMETQLLETSPQLNDAALL